jgi:hypothetical protein
MYFAYLSLPPFPKELIPLCMENIKLIETEPKLMSLNEYKGKMNRATILPKVADNWLVENIGKKIFDVVPEEMKRSFLNYTVYQKYWKREETWGTHPKHIDRGRNWGLNYYIETGGVNTRINWYHEDSVVAETSAIQTGRWCLLNAAVMHSVKGIEPDKTRYYLSMSMNIDSIDNIMPFVISETII